MSFKDWLFWKPMSPEELAQLEKKHNESIESIRDQSTKDKTKHILDMQKLCFQSARDRVNQQIWFAVLHLDKSKERETPRASWHKELDETIWEFLWKMHYVAIESCFWFMSNEHLMQHTESQFKSPELLAAIEENRESALKKFFDEIKNDFEEFYNDFIGEDSYLWEKSYWERISIMEDKRKEEKVKKDLEKETKKAERVLLEAERKKIETEEKVSQWQAEINEEFETKKQAINSGDTSYWVYKIRAPYLWLDAYDELEMYAQEKSNKLQKHFKEILVPQYKERINCEFDAKKMELGIKKGWSAPSLSYIWGLDSLIKDEIQAYQNEKEWELKKIFEES